LNLQNYLSAASLLVDFKQVMEFATAIQSLSYGVLASAGVFVVVDFLKARQELSRAMISRDRREEVR
jgi:hypothetical protein